ncbi:hypothetical protein BCEP27_10469 [Burkholderia cepacia]
MLFDCGLFNGDKSIHPLWYIQRNLPDDMRFL